MDYITSLKTTITKIESEKATNEVELKRLEEEFANVKLNLMYKKKRGAY